MPVSLLLIEDNEDILANLYAYLEPLGYELDCARSRPDRPEHGPGRAF